LLGIILILSSIAYAQVDTASVSGVITDQSGAIVVGAEVLITNSDTNITSRGTSNESGVYLVTGLKPGRYRIKVTKDGFKGIDLTDLVLNVQDSVNRNFILQVGSTSESVSVEGNALRINTQDASVSTVVDRQFAENLPMNGRSFQTLIQLTPGVAPTTSTSQDPGQFSINGQRASSNYWMVDGVSANIGQSAIGGGIAGSLGSFSAQGGTNSLVSVDAMQEFRIQTSTYAPEFGRTPGGQISILTRSGTNQFHGTLFDYLRNDALDANDWFQDYLGLPKPAERQNDFGGTFSGPILKDRSFFFFSYEGLRLRLPNTILSSVPDVAARQGAMPAMQPFLNAYPLPNGTDNPATGVSQFNASFTDPATLDAYSLRIDHKIGEKLNLFGRYNYSPSENSQRGGGSSALSSVGLIRITTQTGTLGTTWAITPATANDFRFNYSRTDVNTNSRSDNFGGAVPLTSLPFPAPFSAQSGRLFYQISSLPRSGITVGQGTHALQQQINLIDSFSAQKGSHSLKFGFDFRRLSPEFDPIPYFQAAFFTTVQSGKNGTPSVTLVSAAQSATFLFRNIGAFAQDTYRVSPRLTLTYGLRWDVDVSPSTTSGPNFAPVTGFDQNNLSNLALAPNGSRPFQTTYGNFAPRLGVAYQVSPSQDWQSVFRGGFGAFFDLATSEAGNFTSSVLYPFGARNLMFGGTFPLNSSAAAPPAITAANLASPGSILHAFDPNLELPYTLQWNIAWEQGLGREQRVSASYVGAVGRRLIQTADVFSPNSSFAEVQLVANTATSDYHALQLQFERRLSHGLQVLASYAWAHSIDTGSAGSIGFGSNGFAPSTVGGSNRGPSDFDIRNAFSAGVTYDIPAPKMNAVAKTILGVWSVESVIQARSALPVSILDAGFFAFNSGFTGNIRPDIFPGQPFYLFGANCATVMQTLGNLSAGQGCAGGKAINPNAFQDPPTDPVTGNPTRQGNVPRNFLRGFGATQWDFGVHRDFPIHESTKLQFRAEMFNLLNHPNFGQPLGAYVSPANGGPAGFGLSTQMLGHYLNGGGGSNLGGGAFSPLYQIGGPRSVQFALKLMF